MIETLRTKLTTHNEATDDVDCKIDINNVIKKIKQHGGTTEDALRELTWEDLQECGLPKLLARSIANNVFRAPQAATSASSTPTNFTVKLDSGPKPVGQMTKKRDVLAVLYSDRDDSDKEEAMTWFDSRNLLLLVNNQTRALAPQEVISEYWEEGNNAQYFTENDVLYEAIAASEIYKKEDKLVDIDPHSLMFFREKISLKNGLNRNTMAQWPTDLKRRCLVVYDIEQNNTRDPGDAVAIAHTLSQPSLVGTKWKVLEDRIKDADVKRITAMITGIPQSQTQKKTPTSNGGSTRVLREPSGSNPPPPPPPTNDMPPFHELLASLFSEHELRSFVRFKFEKLANSLPGNGSSLIRIAEDFVHAAKSNGLMNDVIAAAAKERPRRRDEIIGYL